MIFSRLLAVLAVALMATTATAKDASFQLNVGAQVPEAENVKGFRLTFFYAKNQAVSGLDLGIANFSEAATQSGFAGNMGIVKITGKSSGCACNFVNIHEGEDSGLNAAFINSVKSIPKGVNVGFVNITEGHSSFEINGLGMSKKSDTQIGFVNITEEITNFQIGFLNMAENGFFPIFPIFNFPKK